MPYDPCAALCRRLAGALIALAALPTLAAPVARFGATRAEAPPALTGDLVPFRFEVRNEGDEPLDLQVQANCGCTRPTWPAHLAPGAVGHIETSLSTGGLAGSVTRELVVTTNDPATPKVSLALAVEVRRSVEVLPTPFPVITLPDTGPGALDLCVRFVGHSAAVQGAASSARWLDARVEPAASADEWRVALRVGAEAPQGRSAVVVTLRTTSVRQPTVPVMVVVERGLVATPPSLYFAPVGPDERGPVTREVTLSRAGGGAERCRATCPDRRFTAHLVAGPRPGQATLRVTFRGGPLKSDIRTEALVEPGGGLPALRVPIVAYAPPPAG